MNYFKENCQIQQRIRYPRQIYLDTPDSRFESKIHHEKCCDKFCQIFSIDSYLMVLIEYLCFCNRNAKLTFFLPFAKIYHPCCYHIQKYFCSLKVYFYLLFVRIASTLILIVLLYRFTVILIFATGEAYDMTVFGICQFFGR